MTTRDMTRAQFLEALDRNGFRKPVLIWVTSKDDPSVSYSMVFTGKGKLLRRLTIANLIASREKNRAKRPSGAALAAA